MIKNDAAKHTESVGAKGETEAHRFKILRTRAVSFEITNKIEFRRHEVSAQQTKTFTRKS